MGVFRLITLLLLVAVVFASALWLTTPNVKPLAKIPPEETAFMQLRKAEAAEAGKQLRIKQRWVSLNAISPHLRNAVLVSEDSAFYDHHGVDWAEMKASFERNLKERKIARGGSTITQQLAKNLYLTPNRNPVRKLREIAIAYELEAELSKSRIYELYLNLIEWGDGIFGAEAAARHYFGVSARNLSPDQAALLAAIVPNPVVWGENPGRRVVQRRKAIILKRMNRRFGTHGQTAEKTVDRPVEAPGEVLDHESLDELHEEADGSTPSP
jgi:monofunctional biosynthetic peptidoglycan transglycosylase